MCCWLLMFACKILYLNALKSVRNRLRRMTAIEREEKEKVKKKERKQEEEETMQQATWVKYTFPVKHQVRVSFVGRTKKIQKIVAFWLFFCFHLSLQCSCPRVTPCHGSRNHGHIFKHIILVGTEFDLCHALIDTAWVRDIGLEMQPFLMEGFDGYWNLVCMSVPYPLPLPKKSSLAAIWKLCNVMETTIETSLYCPAADINYFCWSSSLLYTCNKHTGWFKNSYNLSAFR